MMTIMMMMTMVIMLMMVASMEIIMTPLLWWFLSPILVNCGKLFRCSVESACIQSRLHKKLEDLCWVTRCQFTSSMTSISEVQIMLINRRAWFLIFIINWIWNRWKVWVVVKILTCVLCPHVWWWNGDDHCDNDDFDDNGDHCDNDDDNAARVQRAVTKPPKC